MNPKIRRIIIFSSIAIVLILLDQLSKGWARQTLMSEHIHDCYLGNFFCFDYVENTGAFLSLGASLGDTVSFWLLSILPLILLFVFFGYSMVKSEEFSNIKLFAITMICAGGLGNIIDRIFNDRHVTDFMSMSLFGWRTGIFNVADLYITFGVIIMFFFYNSVRKS